MSHDDDTYSRRTFLKKTGAAGVAVVGGTLWATSPAAARARRGRPETPLRHLIISCQENRSFDHYFGYAPQVQAAGFGPPRGYSQPDAAAVGTPRSSSPRSRAPTRRTGGRRSTSRSPAAGWTASTRCPRCSPATATSRSATTPQRELPFYYSLFRNSGLCANYFCSVLGPTWPNRFYLMSGTSGGITTNGQWGYGIFDSARWPIILDLLDEPDVTLEDLQHRRRRCAERRQRQRRRVLEPLGPRPAHDGTQDDYLDDCRNGDLPEVSWVIPSFPLGFDEHPPADVSVGMGFQQQMITALRRSRAMAELRVPAHLRRARRLLRPRGPAAGRRVRPRCPGAALGRLAVCPAWAGEVPEARRARLDVEADRAAARPPDARLDQPHLRHGDADRRRLRHGRRSAPPRDGLESISDLLDLFDF